jgi:hypothetical protein
MDHHAARPRRALVGLAAMAVGATAVVGGLTSAAAAHEGTEPDKTTENLSCAELAEEVGTDEEWVEFKHEGFFADEGEYDLVLSDRGTPDDDSDDAVVTITVTGPKNFNWASNVGIDAVFVKGGTAHGSYIYYYEGNELTSDVDYTVPPYGEEQNSISHITFCWDDEEPPPTSSSSSLPPDSTTTSEATTSTTEAPSSTSSSVAPTTEAPTTSEAPSTTVSSGGGLPVTGSNTGLLVAVGGGLLLAGGTLLATRQYWRRLI